MGGSLWYGDEDGRPNTVIEDFSKMQWLGGVPMFGGVCRDALGREDAGLSGIRKVPYRR